MTAAGYSATPLVRKLGFKPGMRVHYVAAPEAFGALVGELPDGVTVLKRAAGDLDLEGSRRQRSRSASVRRSAARGP